jgi:hypothetical protein
LIQNPGHPSLKVKKLRGIDKCEIRVSRGYRLTFRYVEMSHTEITENTGGKKANSKFEARNPKQIAMFKIQMTETGRRKNRNKKT